MSMRRAAWHALDEFFHCLPAVLISYGLCVACTVYVFITSLIDGYNLAVTLQGAVVGGPLLFALWCANIAARGVNDDCGPTTRFIDPPLTLSKDNL